MHEISLMQSALNAATRAAGDAGATRIESITLRIGALSGVVRDALEFAFEVLKADTPASEARLVIDEVPVVCHCAECDADFEPSSMVFECPTCGRLSSQIVRGREIDLVSMEVV